MSELSNEEILSYAIEEGYEVSFYYHNAHPDERGCVGVPIKFSKNGNSILIRLETYLPYRKYSNQTPTYTEYKYFKIDAMENIRPENYLEMFPRDESKLEIE